MDKFQAKAVELLHRVQTALDSFEIQKMTDGWANDYFAPEEVTEQFPEMTLDVQMLLFADSPQNPLYISALKINNRIEDVKGRYGNCFNHDDFLLLKRLLLKYLEYRAFLEAAD